MTNIARKYSITLLASLALPALLMGCSANNKSMATTSTEPVTAAEPAPTAPITIEQVAPPMREAKPALWVLKDADTTIYLFGTIHLLPKDVVWFKGPVKSAFDSSDALVLEIIEPPMGEMVQLLNKHGTATDGVKLSDRLDSTTRTNYEAQMQGIGIPAAAFEDKLPWFAYITLYGIQLMQSGWDPNSGAESVLTAAAKESKKPIMALETADEQFAIFGGFTIDEQLAMLGEVVNNPTKGVVELNRLLDYWMAGDDTAIGTVMAESIGDAEAVELALLTKRNANWTAWLDKKMDEPGTLFVAVGAAHLAGDKSVQNMLAKEGHIAVRVPN